jgi:hypothetical protein
MDPAKDYYRILGVTENAEEVVIQAAFRALAKKYHPDVEPTSGAAGGRRMVEINEAYQVLSDTSLRAEYDRSRSQRGFEAPDPGAADDVLGEISADWERALEYFPSLRKHAEELRKLSPSLELAFKATVLERKNFGDAAAVAAAIETGYLSRFFGSRPMIMAFAKELILGGHKDAARELNAAVRVLGTGVEDRHIVEVVRRKFPIGPTRSEIDSPVSWGNILAAIFFVALMIFVVLTQMRNR